jgi:hypothetical protein
VHGVQTIKTGLIASFCILITSCAPYTQFTIQVLEPAKITFPSYIQSIALINRSYNLSVEDFNSNEEEISQYELFVLDSAMNNKFFEGLTTGLQESPGFDRVTAEVIQYRRYDTVNYLKILDSIQLNEIKRHTIADALISLEYYAAKDTLSIFYDDYEGYWVVDLVIISGTSWIVYDLHNEGILDNYIQKDTLSWNQHVYFLDEAITGPPHMLEAFREAAFADGYKYSRRITPGWFDAERYLYRSGPGEMQQAAKLAISGNWDDAGVIWEDLLHSEKIKTRAKAAFNLAVKSEGEDKLDEAVRWAEKSIELYPEKHTVEYLNLLLMRELKKNTLSRQIYGDPADER